MSAGLGAGEGREAVHLSTFARHRSLLFSIAYRMLGSVSDAEDMLQETFIRWQRSSDEEIRDPRAFLVTIVTRLCLAQLRSARVKREEYVGSWLPEPIVTDESVDPLGVLRIDESLSMALMLLLERLTPVERAVFILREVFEFEYAEIARALGQSEANCRKLLQRARGHVGTMRQRFAASKEELDQLMRRFLSATREGDLQGLLALLSADVKLYSDGGGKARALPNVIEGSEKVARAMMHAMTNFLPPDLEFETTSINGEPGVISYLNGAPFSAVTVNFREDRVKAVFVVTNPDKLKHLTGSSGTSNA